MVSCRYEYLYNVQGAILTHCVTKVTFKKTDCRNFTINKI